MGASLHQSAIEICLRVLYDDRADTRVQLDNHVFSRSVGHSFHVIVFPLHDMGFRFGFLPRRVLCLVVCSTVCTRFLSRGEYMRVVLLCPTSWETISFQIGLTCPANRSEGVATLDMGNTGGTCKVLRRI